MTRPWRGGEQGKVELCLWEPAIWDSAALRKCLFLSTNSDFFEDFVHGAIWWLMPVSKSLLGLGFRIAMPTLCSEDHFCGLLLKPLALGFPVAVTLAKH